MSGDPVAWRVVERGWRVLDGDGNEIGKVDRIVGDVEADIFGGFTVGDGGTVLTRARYVPAERVSSIREGEIALDLTPEEAAALEPYREVVSQRLADLAPTVDPTDERPQSWVSRIFGRPR